jgi:hypothetical protein
MSNHEYTPQAALELLMRKLAERDSALAAQVRAVVDQGKDIQESESASRGRKKKYRVYRKTVPYLYDEALQVAVKALAACFVEQPMLIDSCLKNMAQSSVGSPRGFRDPRSPKKSVSVDILPGTETQEKDVRIELRTETQLSAAIEPSPPIHEMQPLSPVSPDQIAEQLRNLARLRALVDFREE